MPSRPDNIQILRGYGVFTHTLRKGSVLAEKSLKLWYTQDQTTETTRIGFSVSRMLKNAAVRNRVKRCMREAVRLNKNTPFFALTPPLNIILMYTGPQAKKAGMIRCKDIEEQVVSVMKRLMVRVSS